MSLVFASGFLKQLFLGPKLLLTVFIAKRALLTHAHTTLPFSLEQDVILWFSSEVAQGLDECCPKTRGGQGETLLSLSCLMSH